LPIYLTNDEIKHCLNIAEQRCANNDKRGLISENFLAKGGISQVLLDAVSYGGEIAVAKVLNLYPDLSVSCNAGADLKLGNQRADVKTSFTAPCLKVRGRQMKKTDIKIFIGLKCVDRERFGYKVLGWTTREELFAPQHFDHTVPNKDGCYKMSASQLRAMETIMEVWNN
jgi:hypothetical protein